MDGRLIRGIGNEFGCYLILFDSSQFIQIFDVGAHCAINSLHIRIHGFDHVILIRSMRAAAVAHTEVPGSKMQWIPGKDVSRPRSRAAWKNDGVNSFLMVHSNLCADERRV